MSANVHSIKYIAVLPTYSGTKKLKSHILRGENSTHLTKSN